MTTKAILSEISKELGLNPFWYQARGKIFMKFVGSRIAVDSSPGAHETRNSRAACNLVKYTRVHECCVFLVGGIEEA